MAENDRVFAWKHIVSIFIGGNPHIALRIVAISHKD